MLTTPFTSAADAPRTRLFEDARPREQPDWARPSDFELGSSRRVSARMVVEELGWSLYSFDRPTRSAWFVDLPPDVDLSEVPFVHMEQHRRARRVLQVPFGELSDLAARIAPPEHVIFLINIARCGSTLCSRALNNVPGVWSLSEPDIYTRLAQDGYLSTTPTDYTPDELVQLIQVGTRLLFRPPPRNGARVLALKLRSQASIHAHLYHRALPDASFVFLYRDALSWANSFYRMMRKFDIPAVLTGESRVTGWSVTAPGQDPSSINALVDLEAEEVCLEDAFAPGWAFNMQTYLRHLQAGVPYLALRYDDLTADPQSTLRRLFRHCLLPEEAVIPALAAFEKDSQAGTPIARDIPMAGLSDAQIAKLSGLLARAPAGLDADLRLPDMYSGASGDTLSHQSPIPIQIADARPAERGLCRNTEA